MIVLRFMTFVFNKKIFIIIIICDLSAIEQRTKNLILFFVINHQNADDDDYFQNFLIKWGRF